MIIGHEWMLGFLELSVGGYDRSRAIIIIAHPECHNKHAQSQMH